MVETIAVIVIIGLLLIFIGSQVYTRYYKKYTRGAFIKSPATIKSGEFGHFVWEIVEWEGINGNPSGIGGRSTTFVISPPEKGKIVRINDANGNRGLGSQNPDGSWTGVTSVTGVTFISGKIEIFVTVDYDKTMEVTATDNKLGKSETKQFQATQ